nr:sel1-like protein [Tanacetum cinerariifolium]
MFFVVLGDLILISSKDMVFMLGEWLNEGIDTWLFVNMRLISEGMRGLHTRNKMAMEYIAKGWNALKEVDSVIDYCELIDKCIIPHLKIEDIKTKKASRTKKRKRQHKKETEKRRFWHLDIKGELLDLFNVLDAKKRNTKPASFGAVLLVEVADMGDADAQYELSHNLRIENEGVHANQQAFYYLEKATDQDPDGTNFFFAFSAINKSLTTPKGIHFPPVASAEELRTLRGELASLRLERSGSHAKSPLADRGLDNKVKGLLATKRIFTKNLSNKGGGTAENSRPDPSGSLGSGNHPEEMKITSAPSRK